VFIPKIGEVRWKRHRFHLGKVKHITISQNGSQWYCSVTCELDMDIPQKQDNNIVGIDLGIKNFVISSEGAIYDNLNFKKNQKKKLKKLQRNLSRKKKGSNNRNKARILLAKKFNKINHQKEHFLHSVVNQLIRDNQTIVMEDLNVKGMLKNHKLAEAISNVSWSKFKEILSYKCEWYNRKLVSIDRWFPSSKLCSECNYKNDSLILSDRDWVCKACGTHHDRDINAAINIKNEGQRIIGMSLPESTLMECKSLDPLRSKKNSKITKNDTKLYHF